MTGMRALLVLLSALAWPIAPAAARDCVVLLHGLARSDASLLVMEEALALEGYRVVNTGYDSTGEGIEALAARTLPPAVAACAEAPRTHFVTHSMGGILLRVWARDHALPPGRTVMLAPPNQGSELVDALEDIPPFDWVNGPAGRELTTDGPVRALGPVWAGVGVIAGDRSLSPVYSAILPGPDDGKVTVASTRVEGMADHLVLPVTHTFLMNAPVVIVETLNFLREGRFDPEMGIADAVGELLPDALPAAVGGLLQD